MPLRLVMDHPIAGEHGKIVKTEIAGCDKSAASGIEARYFGLQSIWLLSISSWAAFNASMVCWLISFMQAGCL